jgi:hypothetical protein
LLAGVGEVWMNDWSLDVVDIGTPTTGTNPRTTLSQRPVNLGFYE